MLFAVFLIILPASYSFYHFFHAKDSPPPLKKENMNKYEPLLLLH